MFKKILILCAVLVFTLSLLGCGNTQKATDSSEDLTQKDSTGLLEETGVEDVDEVSEELNDLDTTDSDLELDELDSLDQDLENLDW